MALFNRTQVGLRETSQSVTVADDPKGKLMYYLDCMCSVLKLDDNQDINRLRRHRNLYTLTHADTSVLISLGILLKPDVLLNKCIFQNDSLCGEFGNKFFDLETVQRDLMFVGSVMIGGQNKQVTKIMTFKMSWLHTNWTNPIKFLLQRQEREEAFRIWRPEQEEEALRREQRQEREEALRRQQEQEEEALRRQQQQEREEALRRSKACIIL